MDWKKVKGEDKKTLECNSENKMFLYDDDRETMMNVINKSAENHDKIIEKKT